MRPVLARRAASGVALLLVLATALAAPAAALPGPAASAPLTGSIQGPHALPLSANATYYLNATGGPAFSGSVQTGVISWKATVAGVNLTGVSVAPGNGTITPGIPGKPVLTVSNLSQTLTLEVEITSTGNGQSASINLTYTVQVLQPYVVTAKLYTGATAVLAFQVVVALDGRLVGNVSVPGIQSNATYNLTYRYAGAPLGPGDHTFVLSLSNAHGLVRFANGLSSFSTTFYVAGPPTSYSIWYAAGIIAFFGALLIFATRVAARRRGSGRR